MIDPNTNECRIDYTEELNDLFSALCSNSSGISWSRYCDAEKGYVSNVLFEYRLDDAGLAKMGPAAAFYLFYVGGVLWFASIPALQSGHPSQAFVAGFVLGLLAFGTYEFTNFATLRGWVIQMVAVDVVWGGVLTGTSAWVGVSVVKAFS